MRETGSDLNIPDAALNVRSGWEKRVEPKMRGEERKRRKSLASRDYLEGSWEKQKIKGKPVEKRRSGIWIITGKNS